MVYFHLLKDHRQECLKSKALDVASTNVVVQACCSSSLSVPKRKAIQPVCISSDEEDDDELQRTIQESLNF